MEPRSLARTMSTTATVRRRRSTRRAKSAACPHRRRRRARSAPPCRSGPSVTPTWGGRRMVPCLLCAATPCWSCLAQRRARVVAKLPLQVRRCASAGAGVHGFRRRAATLARPLPRAVCVRVCMQCGSDLSLLRWQRTACLMVHRGAAQWSGVAGGRCSTPTAHHSRAAAVGRCAWHDQARQGVAPETRHFPTEDHCGQASAAARDDLR